MPVEERQLLLGIQYVAITAGERTRRKLIESGQPPGCTCGPQISLRPPQVLVWRKRILDEAVERGSSKPGPVSLDAIPVLKARLPDASEIPTNAPPSTLIIGSHPPPPP